MTVPVLTTRRLILRPLEARDATPITDVLQNWEVTGWLTAPPFPFALADAQDYIANRASGAWAITHNDTFIGIIAGRPDLGYWLDPAHQGQGFMIEAVDAVVDHAFATSTDPIQSGHLLGNAGSRSVLLYSGFTDSDVITAFARPQNAEVSVQKMLLAHAEWQENRTYYVETDRLILRELRETDVLDIARIGSDIDVARMMLTVKSPWDIKDVADWVAHSRYRGRPGFRPAVCLKDGTLIGTLGIGKSPGAQAHTCAYFFDKSHWGRGYASEAMQAFLADCFARFDLDTVEADHFVDNPASGHVLRKLGFTELGKSTGPSAARLEPAPTIDYRLTKAQFAARSKGSS